MVAEIALQIDVSSSQVDEAGLSRTEASPVTEVISKIMQTPSGRPQDIASPSRMALEFPIPSSADTSAMITLSILSVIILQLAAEVINDDIVIRPVTGPHTMVVEVLQKQFLAIMKDIVPLLLQDVATSESAIAGKEGLVGSIRCFDVQLADCLKLMFDRLRTWLNLLIVSRADLEASVVRTTTALKAAKML